MNGFGGLRDWYLTLAPRERLVVTWGAAALLLIVIWLAIIAPWLGAKASLQSDVEADTQLLAWMQQATAEIKQLEKIAPAAAPQANQSLFATVEQTARTSPIGNAIKQFQPQGNDSVQVHLDAAPFDALVSWLGRLQAQHGVLVAAFGMQRADKPGTVNADITLERPKK
ncbi:MAG TPA: type II secretion system protein M [Gammaproteobacteria bacterium]|nr:type II secretion system protein M [Gammaproteobacteria bacterium]